MHTIINLKEIDYSFFEKLRELYGKKEVWLSIREVPKPNPTKALDGVQLLEKKDLSKTIEKFKIDKPIRIDPDIDIRALIDEASDPKITFK